MRDLHAQIRREVVRKDMADHIKLGPVSYTHLDVYKRQVLTTTSVSSLWILLVL